MTDVEQLKRCLEDKLIFDYGSNYVGMKEFTLQDLKELRQLVQNALIQRLVEYSPSTYNPIFKDLED